jgi:hypothetical protein
MLAGLLLGSAALVTSGLSFFASLAAAVVEIAFLLVPVVFMLSLIMGLGARNWGRCL